MRLSLKQILSLPTGARCRYFFAVSFLKRFLADTCPFGGHWYPCFDFCFDFDFWWHLLWDSKPDWILNYSLFCGGECNVHSLRSTSGVTHAKLLVVGITTGHFPHKHQQMWDLALIWTGDHPYRRRTHYHCASDPVERSVVNLSVSSDKRVYI